MHSHSYGIHDPLCAHRRCGVSFDAIKPKFIETQTKAVFWPCPRLTSKAPGTSVCLDTKFTIEKGSGSIFPEEAILDIHRREIVVSLHPFTPLYRFRSALAVVVCEMFKLGGKKPSTDLYRRTSSKIEGLTVTITFETAPLNTKPKSNSYSCSFHEEDEGFKINGENSSEYEKCSKLADAIMNNSLETPTEKDEVESLISEIKRCEGITIKQMKNMISEFTSVEYPLNSLGIYPIKPEDTILGK